MPALFDHDSPSRESEAAELAETNIVIRAEARAIREDALPFD